MKPRRANYSTWRRARTALRKRYAAVGLYADEHIPALRSVLIRGLTIFIFHEVTDSPSAMQLHFGIFTPTALFADQIRWLRERFTFVRPTELPQLGADGALPENAALVTFDDCWRGVFRIALPLLERLGVPSICFVNMATVGGDPDLSAVRGYEELRLPAAQRLLGAPIDTAQSARILDLARERYATSSEFQAFQGETVTHADLARMASSLSLGWLGSHLYHHWEIHEITPDLYERSLTANRDALSAYPNALPVFALPGGYPSPGDSHALSLPQRLGYRVVMTAMGRQNKAPDGPVLDRLPLPIVPSKAADWWHACHRRRLLGRALRE